MSKQGELVQIAKAIALLREHGASEDRSNELVKRHGHKHVFATHKRGKHLLEKLIHEVEELEEEVEKLEDLLKPKKARSSTLSFKNSTGETTMPLTVHLNDAPVTALFEEFAGLNGTGQKVPPTGTVLYKSDNEAVATVDAATGALSYVAEGQANISADDSGNLPASDLIIVTAAVAKSSTLTFVPPAA